MGRNDRSEDNQRVFLDKKAVSAHPVGAMDVPAPLEFFAGMVLLLVGAELLVRGASKLAVRFGMSPSLVGLTIVSLGTSAPEVGVSLNAAINGRSDLALGNVVGSNTMNILLVLGASALISPLVVDRRLIRRDLPMMLASAIVLYVLCLDGSVSRTDGIFLLLGLVAFLWVSIRNDRHRVPHVLTMKEGEAPTKPRSLVLSGAEVAGGALGLVGGSQLLVHAATRLAASLGISELLVGLTVVAVGTSLPELATSVWASYRGHRDIAVANVIGSNVFNVLAVLGLSAFFAPTGIHVAKTALQGDLIIMLAASAACLPVFLAGYRIVRWEGALFLLFYAAYVAGLFLSAFGHPVADTLIRVMWVIVPATLFIFLMLVFIRREPSEEPS